MSPPKDEPRLLDRFMRYADQGTPLWAVLVLIGIVGLGLGVRMTVWVLDQPWDLDASSPVVTGSPGDCGPLTAGRYEIEVDGHTYSCGGAEDKCAQDEAEVAYDPRDPSRCRAAARVDGLGVYEMLGVLTALAFTFGGLAGLGYWVSEKLRKADLGEDEPRWGLTRRWLRAFVWVALVLAMLATVSSAASWATWLS